MEFAFGLTVTAGVSHGFTTIVTEFEFTDEGDAQLMMDVSLQYTTSPLAGV